MKKRNLGLTIGATLGAAFILKLYSENKKFKILPELEKPDSD